MFDSLTRMGSSAAGAYEIERSLRFNDDDTPYLERTVTSASNRKTWTISLWFKRSTLETYPTLFGQTDNAGSYMFYMIFNNDDTLYILDYDYPSNNFNLITNRKFRDTSAWYHLVLAVDTTQATDTNRAKVYINGVQETSFSTAGYPSQNLDTFVNNTTYPVRIGKSGWGGTTYMDGYIAEYNFIDGSALGPESFGKENALTGQWVPKKYVGSYGTNGFYLNFSDNSNTTSTTLGKDSSGNGNNFTPNNFSVAAGEGNDSVTDTPTNNFCTWNVVDSKGNPSAISNGALVFKDGNGSVYQAHGTIATPDINAHKYYFEAKVAQGYAVGIAPLELSGADNETGRTGTYVVYSNGKKYSGTTSTAYTGSWSSATVIGVAIGEGKIKFFKAGNDEGDAFTGLSGPYKPYAWAAGATLTGVELNCGQQPFQHTPPTGYKALCTANLPEPTILKGTDYFDTELYTPNSGNLSVTGFDFQPNLLWLKSRTQAYRHYLFDSVRGTGQKALSSNLTAAEGDDSGSLTSFDSGGFTTSGSSGFNDNGSGTNGAVAWAWKESPAAGFDIVPYVGDGNNSRAVSHGLGVSPGLVIVKDRDLNSITGRWTVLHSYDTSKNLELDQTSEAFSHQSRGSITAVSSSTFTLYGSTDNVTVNENGDNYIAYLWANVEGYCRIGKYTGNGSTRGTFVYTGFKPAWVLIKSSSNAEAWNVFDNARDTDNYVHHQLVPNTSTEENSTTTARRLDFLSNGFKLKGSDGTINTNNYTYIYLAIAERPFKYANAR